MRPHARRSGGRFRALKVSKYLTQVIDQATKSPSDLLCMGLFSRFLFWPPAYITASSTMPMTNTTKPAAVAAANDRSTLSMMPPR